MSFSAVPLGHKFTAVLLAAAVGGGVYTWFRRDAVQKASTSELSFDMHAARRIDAGLVQAPEPAVVFAQSVLTDQKLAELSKTAYLSTSGMMSRVGEFRSRLELTQPSAQVLDVRFRDPDPGKAVATANAVANALTSWAPSPDGPAQLNVPAEPVAPAAAPPAPAAHPAPAKQPAKAAAPAPAQKPVVRHEDAANPGLASGLNDLQAQLTSTNAKLEQLARGEGSRGHAYAESEQQQLLRAQVREAEQKAASLRAQATGDDRGRIGAIQQALAGIMGGGGIGVSASRIRRERDALTQAIAVVERQRQALQKDESSATGSADNAAETPPPSTPSDNSTAPTAAAAPASGAISESNLSASGASGNGASGAESSAAANEPQPAPIADGPDAAMLNPLHVTKEAGVAAQPIWWPAAAAGVLCGLLYWLIAAAAARPVEYADDTSDSGPAYGRFITPDAPLPPSPPPAAPPPAAAPEPAYERGGGSYRRASFTYESTPEGRGMLVEDVPAAAAPRAAEPEPAAVPDVQATAMFEEKVVEIDPWMDLMEKALSETEIGRRFEKPAGRDESAARKQDDPRRPGRPDRLAG
ncbi:MAG: hypothetical protein ACLGXA_05580 [Acidobacteriota bacterium]